MEAILDNKKQSYTFDHKLKEDEIHELVENYDYDPENYPDDGGKIWDEFGKPTESTICAMYEDKHDIGEGPMTLDEFHAWLHEVLFEDDDEE